jgi:hypothetical protein
VTTTAREDGCAGPGERLPSIAATVITTAMNRTQLAATILRNFTASLL